MNSNNPDRMDVDSTTSESVDVDRYNLQSNYMKHFKVKQDSRKKRRGELKPSNYNRRNSLPNVNGNTDVRAMQNHFKLISPAVSRRNSVSSSSSHSNISSSRSRSKSVDYSSLPIQPSSKRRLSAQYVVNFSAIPIQSYERRWSTLSYRDDPKIRKFSKLVEAGIYKLLIFFLYLFINSD